MVKKITYLFIQGATESLKEILAEKLPIKIALQIIRNTDRIEKEMNIFIEANKVIADKYRGEDKKITEDKMPEFRKEMDELFKTELELDLNPIDFKLIENIPTLSLKPSTIKILSEIGLLIGVEESQPEPVATVEPKVEESK